LLSHYRNRLIVHPTYQIARPARLAQKRHLKHVVRYAFLHHLAYVVRYLVEPVRRAQATDTLVRAPEVVILHPQLRTLLHVLKSLEERPAEKLLLDRLPEPFDLPLCLRVVRL